MTACKGIPRSGHVSKASQLLSKRATYTMGHRSRRPWLSVSAKVQHCPMLMQSLSRTSVPSTCFLKFVAVRALTKGESKLPAETIVRRHASSRSKALRRVAMFSAGIKGPVTNCSKVKLRRV